MPDTNFLKIPPSAGPPVAGPTPDVHPGDFAEVLVALGLPSFEIPSDRQPLASGGKDLPAADVDAAGVNEATDDPADDASSLANILWLPAIPVELATVAAQPVAPPLSAALSPSGDVGCAATQNTGKARLASPDVAPRLATTTSPALDAIASTVPPNGALVLAQPITGAPTHLRTGQHRPALEILQPRVALDASVEAQAPPAPAATPTPDLTVGNAARPAAEVFAARLADAVLSPAKKTRDDLSSLAPGPSHSAIRLELPHAAVTASVQTAGAQLDTRDPEWLHKMIDHIETVQGERGTHETRIRLSPDALGSLDIAIGRKGDATEVRITAEQAATRALIAEAAPRLTELAESRGLKLGQPMTGDPSPDSQRQSSTPTPHFARPASAFTASGDPRRATDDELRIA